MTACNPSNPSSCQPPVHFWRTVYSYVRPYRGRLLFSAVCSAIVGVMVAAQPLIIKFIVDNGINRPNADIKEKVHYALLFIGVYLLSSILRVSWWALGYKRLVESVEGFIFAIRARLFRHVQHLCFRFHDEISSGELYNYLMGSPINSIKGFSHQIVMTLPYQIVCWVVSVVALAYMDWLMLLVILFTVIVACLANQRSRAIVREMSETFMATESHASRYIADLLSGCRAIKIHAAEDIVTDRFMRQAGLIRDQGAALTYRQCFEGLKPETIQYFGMALLYGMGVYSCLYRDMSVGVLMAFVSCVGQLMGPILTLLNLNLVKANAEAGLNRIERVLERVMTTIELPANMRTTVDGEAQRAAGKNIPCFEMRHVVFGYDEQRPIFNNLSCTIAEGQSVALVGSSGSGKSTFVNLLLRLYDPQQGRILLYGDDLYHYALKDIRVNFGVVPQMPFYFQANILENVRVVRPEAAEEEVWQALRLAEAEDFVRALPQNIQTPIGESGFNLSGGQRQRLAIARAILSRPRFFVFDEATSALDNQSELRIQKAMEQIMKNHTTFIIAHRLSTVIDSDLIVVMDNGKLVSSGKHEELLLKCNLYRTLYERQFGG